MANSPEIYADFLKHCGSAQVAWLGRDLQQLQNAYSCNFNGDEVLSDLMQHHSGADLVQAGIAIRADDGGLRLKSCIDGRGQIVIALLTKGSKHPFEIIADEGCVSDTRLPACAILADELTQELLEIFENTLLVTSSITDAMILRRCGVPAVVCAGVERLREPYLSQFVSSLRLAERTQIRSAMRPTLPRRWGPKIVLLCASLATMSIDCPDRTRSVEVHLQRLAVSCDWDATGMTKWQPGREFLETFAFVATSAHPKDCRHLLLTSLRQEAQCLVVSRPPQKNGIGLREAFAKWSLANGRRIDADLREKAWELLGQEWDETLIWPLVMAAESCQEPVAANLHMMLAELMRMVHPLTAKLSEKCRDRSRDQDGFFCPIQKDDGLDRLLQVANLALRYSRDVLRWRENAPLTSLPFPRRSQSTY